ncbi:MAG: LexA family protein [Limisphaerales bacterium]
MKPPYTSRQGQFLAFIHHYSTLHGRPPAEAEMVQFFQVTPPTVHQMILTLERRGLITRAPGQARSIKMTLPPEKLPPLSGASVFTGAPLPVRQTQCQQSIDTEAPVLRLGKIQIEDLFAHYGRNSLDDSEFIPLLDTLIESFGRAGLSAVRVKELRRHACELYHRCCQGAEPESTMESNMELMFSYLSSSSRTRWHRWK